MRKLVSDGVEHVSTYGRSVVPLPDPHVQHFHQAQIDARPTQGSDSSQRDCRHLGTWRLTYLGKDMH